METRREQIKRLKRTWGSYCVLCDMAVLDQDAVPYSNGIAHKRCGTRAVIEGDAIDAEEESRIPSIRREEAATQAMVENGETHA